MTSGSVDAPRSEVARVAARTIPWALAFWLAAASARLPLDMTLANPIRGDLVPGWIEGEWLLLCALAGAGAWVATGLAAREPEPALARARAASRTLWTWALVHVVLVLAAGTFVTRWARLTDDADVYRMQARMLLSGQVAEPSFPIRSAVTNLFVIDVGSRDGVPYWSGCYPLLASVWTAPGFAVGFDNLLWVLAGALLVVQVARLAEDLWPEADGALVAALVATSPALVALGTTAHTSLLATLFAATAARLVVRLAGDPNQARSALALGATLGLGVLARPLDGALGIGLAALALAAAWRGAPRELGRIGAFVVAGGLPFAAIWAAHNHAVTGSATVMPYSLLEGGVPVYGFGEDVLFGPHGPLRAVVKTVTALLRLTGWISGWPILWAAAWCALRAWRDPRMAWLLAAAAAHLVAYALAPYGAMPTTGTTYHVYLVPFVVLALAGGLRRDREGLRRRAAALAALGAVTFVPVALVSLGASASFGRAPLLAGERLRQEHGRVLIEWTPPVEEPLRSVVLHPPVPAPGDDVVWVSGEDPTAFDRARALLPDHAPYRMWRRGEELTIERAP
jgi:hypothetical protein